MTQENILINQRIKTQETLIADRIEIIKNLENKIANPKCKRPIQWASAIAQHRMCIATSKQIIKDLQAL